MLVCVRFLPRRHDNDCDYSDESEQCQAMREDCGLVDGFKDSAYESSTLSRWSATDLGLHHEVGVH